MASAESITLHPYVKYISECFDVIDNDLRLSDQDFTTICQELTQVNPGEREKIGQDLLALAIKIHRIGDGAGAIALAQLFLMVGRVLADFAKARMLFRAGDIDLSQAAQWMGQQLTRPPVEKGNLTDRSSVFGLQIKK